ncbi:sugar ABC transporter ATP-binding protein [Pseudonocardia sp. MH-G8]|uniref:sugar ABC transporter ATP-binding protein n=1 Tax=Pseudonocardia sp. MH-G8 TaxID=1854588 RepID=UPI000BA0CDCE|nr:sugar ABC transporter ATP-binding protein [Pseudonocardia sp. MH-G8]OZM77905.1 D-xylose ABC transporter ATP-binding protein [Pseudonocardia sp. MH-G8]
MSERQRADHQHSARAKRPTERGEATAPPLLEMQKVSKSYPGVRALDGVSMTVRAGEVLALVGENGAGKSTLIKILSGAVRPDAGTVRIDGEAIDIAAPLDATGHGIATVYQEFSLFPALSVAENLFFNDIAVSRRPLSWSRLRADAVAVLRELGVDLEPRRPVRDLTVAEQQMLEIAKALHMRARIVVLDEPTAVLGGHDVDRLLDLIRSLRERGVAVIFISHRLDEIFGVANTYLVLKDGRHTAAGRVADTDRDALVTAMVGRAVSERREIAHVGHDRGAELLRVEGLSGAGFTDASFTVHAGEVVGVAGLRGAGRTEVARAVFGIDRSAAGRVVVRGQELPPGRPDQAIAAGIGFVTEDRKAEGLLMNMSVAQNMTMVDVAVGRRRWLARRAERATAERLMADLSVRAPNTATRVDTLSGGNQQKVVIAKWVGAGVEVLLLDEPTRGVDVGAKGEIYKLIRQLCDQGLGVLLISSELPEILLNSDRVLVMQRGRICAELSRAEATEENIARHMVSEVAA